MKRSTTMAVAGAASVLVAAGQLPRMPWERWAVATRTSLTQMQWPELERLSIAPPRLDAERVAAWIPHFSWSASWTAGRQTVGAFLSGPWPAVLLGAMGGLLVLFLLSRLLRPADARRRVLDLARRGRPLAGIARAARLPQDTVRAMLLPPQNLPRLPR